VMERVWNAPRGGRQQAMRNECEIPRLRIESLAGIGIGSNEVDLEKVKGEEKKEILQGALYTYEKIQQAYEKGQNNFTPLDISKFTGKSPRTESRYLKELSDKGLLERVWHNKQYQYKLNA
jgi:Fic family protein